MKKFIYILYTSLCAVTFNINAFEQNPLIYINQNVGFNVEGYSYDQPALPCDVDNQLVNLLVNRSNKTGMHMEPVNTKEKVKNGKIPVVLVDIEQLVIGEEHNYGTETNNKLPKVQITAGVLKGSDIQTAKHTCVIASSSNLLLSTDKVVYKRPPGDICGEVNKCLEDLSKDVIDWVKPQIMD